MSQIIRTYSRKGKRAARDEATSVDDSHSPERERDTTSRKKQKIRVEAVHVESTSDSDDDIDILRPSSSRKVYTSRARVPRTEAEDRASPDAVDILGGIGSSASKRLPWAELPKPILPKSVLVPMKRSQSQSSRPAPASIVPKLRQSHSTSSAKAEVGFLDLFEGSIPPVALTTSKAGGVAKRMLRRTQTDTGSRSGTSSPTKSLEVTASAPSVLQRTPTKLALTKTESLIDLTGSPGSTGSRPPTPSKSRSQEGFVSPEKISARPSLANTNTRTYAGKSRSFLVAMPMVPAASSSKDLVDATRLDEEEEDEFETRESYADLRARWGVDNSEDDPYPLITESQSPPHTNKTKGKQKQTHPSFSRLPAGMMNDLKSISELRSKGESRRFLDDMGYLFEGLDPEGAIGVRRGSALEIVTKLCDSDFARKAKAADFFSKAWQGLRGAGAGNGDKVLDTALALFAALVCRDPVDATYLATRVDFIPTLYKMLSLTTHKTDPLWLISCGMRPPATKFAGLTRTDIPPLETLQKMVQTKSGLGDDLTIPSNRLLISMSLAAIPPSLHSSTYLPIVLANLQQELLPLTSRMSAYTTGLPLIPPLEPDSYTDIPSFAHASNCLHLLDSYLLGRWQGDETLDGDNSLNDARDDGLGSRLLSLCVAVDVLSRDTLLQGSTAAAQRCLESAFRVLVNLTHDNLDWCNASIGSHDGLPSVMRLLSTSHAQHIRAAARTSPSGGLDLAVHHLDRLCLILGILTNLVQLSDEAIERMRDIKLSPQCPGERSCAVACHCPAAVSALECLVQIYEQQSASENDFESVVRGHIAVLFGLLMQGHPRNQMILLRHLSGPSRRKKVESLVENTREFTLFYAEFMKKAADATRLEDGDEDPGGEVDGHDEDAGASPDDVVVKQVLTFFQDLLDSFEE